jgi:signal transduction histidine kinase
MSEQPAAGGLDALQQVSTAARASADASQLATQVLGGDSTVTQAVEMVGLLLSSYPGVDLVAASLTLLNPEDSTAWVHLGERAWLREWSRPGTSCSVAPREDAGPEQALSMPWLSQQAARRRVVVVPDAERLPDEAQQDRREMAACGVQSLATSAIVSDGAMFGSVAMCRESAAAWPDEYVADLRLLSAALGSRMAATRAREALADAIKRGDLARASQQEFFSAIGHELRTPIAAIVGTAEMLGGDARELLEAQRPATGPESVTRFAAGAAKDADVVLGAGEKLLAIVDDLLETGQELGGGAESKWVDVADAVSDVIHWLRTPALSAGISVAADVPPGLLVLTTPSGLRQILTNLIGNAITYNSPGGTVRVTTSTTRDEFGEPRARVSVQDTGPGLTTEQQREVFKPFVRFAAPEIRGTGLGLSLSRSLAERDGGMMGLESTPGEGSVFWVDLPAAPPGTPVPA